MSEQIMKELGKLAGKDFVNTLARVFRCQAIAEEEITAAKKRNKKANFDGHFMALKPPASFIGKSDDLYRHHVRELLERVAKVASRNPLSPATKAEVLAKLMDESLIAPPSSQYVALAPALFREVFPNSGIDLGVDDGQPWPTSNEELLADLRKRLRVEDRK